MGPRTFNRRIGIVLICCLMLGLFSMPIGLSNAGTQPKEITIACSRDSYPFHYADENGKAAGITIDFWNLWSKKTGIKVKYLISDWDTSLKNVKDKKADVHAGCFYTAERDAYLDYAFPIVEAETHIFYNAALQNIRELKDLRPFTVGVVKGDYSETFVRNNLKDASLRTFNSYEAIMAAAKEGSIQVFVADTLTALPVMEKVLPVGLFTYNVDQPLYTNFFYAAAQDGKSDLVQRINAGMGSIVQVERQAILDKWLPKSSGGMNSVKIAISMDYPPFSFQSDSGNPQGLLVDMWRLWGQKTGTNIEFVMGSWSKTLKDVESGAADIHSGLFYTEERSKFMNFSQMYYEVESRIFFNTEQKIFEGVKDLQGKVVGANKNSYQETYLREHYPTLKVIGFENSTSMVEAADYGLIDAFIEESAALKGNYAVYGKAFNNKALPDVSFREDMLAGITKNKPDLLNKVNQGLEQITQDEWQELEIKWISDPTDRIFVKPVELGLTDAEKAWIRNHPVIRVGADKNQNPVQYQDGPLAKGIATDYARYILGRIGIKPEIKLMDWPDILSAIKTGDTLDASFNIQKTDERSKYLSFSRPFLKVPHMIVTKADRKLINSFAELKGKTVAVEKGYYKIEYFNKDNAIKMLEVGNTLEALLAVSSGRADAYIGDKLTTANYISANSLKNLRISEYTELGTYNVSVGFRKEMAPLADIINKVLDTMTESEKKQILSKYSGLDEGGSIYLSEAEQVWLRNHNPVRAGMQNGWAPVEYVNELEETAGVSSDYSSRFERMLNVQLNPFLSSSYSELVDMMKTGKLDIITAAVKSPDKFKYMSFSKPYMVSPMALITLDESPFVGGLDNISEERLGVIKDGFSEDMLKLYHSDLTYQRFPDEANLYQALSNGTIDLILDSMVSIDYMSRLKGISNLRVSNITEYNYEICFGIRRDWQATLIIVNKMLDSISAVEKDSTEKYWLSKLPPDKQPLERYRNNLIIVSAVVLLIAGLVIFWNRKLQREINDRKQIEIELKAAKESADVASRSKTEFLANMSHEIRTPMNAVIGMATLMGRTDLSHQQRDYLNKIIQAAYNLLNLINGILDFSKIEAGKMDLEEVEFELEAVLDNVASIIGLKAKDKNIELIIRKEASVPLRLIGDPLRLEQVLVNLASNAIKFTHVGEVEITIRSTRHDDNQVTVRFGVRDTGIGMSEEQISLLFQPFTQSDSSTTRKFGGTGLGLSISKKLIELMGGHIWASCQLGSGCMFSFEVALKYVKGAGQTDSTLMSTLGDLRVLVVEDNPSARDVLEGYMADFNLETDSFESGEEALEALEIQDYDLILMDWRLGGIDGLETARIIQNMNLKHRPKIIMVTAYGNEELLEGLQGDGVDGMLMKPVSESVLFNTIQNLFSEGSDHDKWSAPHRMRLNENFLKGRRILVVEDNAMNQQLAQELLESVGAKVSVAENGLKALVHLEKTMNAYDLVFMDLQMPEMDGFEATQRIRKMEGWGGIPIIAMTADVLTGIYESCLNSGMNDYISKPIRVEELYEKLAFWLEIREPYYTAVSTEDVPHLEGNPIDSHKAIKNLGGNVDLYHVVLERFAETYGDFDAAIQARLKLDTHADALRYFHTLKGHGGNIGSDVIAQEAETAENLLKNGDLEALKTVTTSLGNHIQMLISGIKRDLKQKEVTPSEADSWNPDELIHHFDALRQSVKSKKPTAIQEGLTVLFEKRVPQEVDDDCRSLKKLCDRYKYKEAGALIEGIVDRLKKLLWN